MSCLTSMMYPSDQKVLPFSILSLPHSRSIPDMPTDPSDSCMLMQEGLSGAQTAWATGNKKYHSHRNLPPSMIARVKESITR